MHYNDRITVVTFETSKDELGSEVKTPVTKTVPCYRGRLSHNQQVGLFGKYNRSAFSIHLLGHYENIDRVIYKGTEKDVQSIYYHRNSTVVIV